MRFLKTGLAAAGLLAATAALADTPPGSHPAPNNIRGKVVSLTADKLVVKPKHGARITIKLSPDWAVVVMKPVDVGAIQPGSFIGTTEIETPDGAGRSLEVHVFPPGVKIGEGHYPWDLKPGSMMTNGTVGQVIEGAKGRMLEVAYPGATRHILVPPNVPVVATAPGARSLLAPGVSVFILPGKTPDGALAANRVLVGVNGAAPPM